jgi:predicted nucleic acid-binding protein
VKPAAVNASPVIILSRAGFFELLPRIFEPIVVPQAVVDEINDGPAVDPAISALCELLFQARVSNSRAQGSRRQCSTPPFHPARQHFTWR